MKEKLIFAVIGILLLALSLNYTFTTFGKTTLLQSTKLCKDNTYCTEKIEVMCMGCTQEQLQFLQKISQYQETVTECMSNYFEFAPEKIKYIVDKPNPNFTCNGEECLLMGISLNGTVKFDEFPAFLKKGEKISKENMIADVHETTHAFAFHALGNTIPKWFDEGLAIQTDTRVQCHPKQFLEKRMSEEKLEPVLIQLKNGEKLNDIIKVPTEHEKGAIFFYALDKEFGCTKDCVAKIFKNLYERRMEKITHGQLSQTSPFLTNQIIKQEIEKTISRDISWLFNSLLIIP